MTTDQTDIRTEQGPSDDHSRIDLLWSDLEHNGWAGGPILRGEWPAYPTTLVALPTATSSNRFRTVILAGAAGVADKLYTCMKSAADTYSWVQTGPVMVAGSSTSDLKDDLVSNGLVTDGGATPLNLDGGALTAGATSVTSLTVNGVAYAAGLILEAADTTERTTAATTLTDLVTFSGLSIAVAKPLIIQMSFRKTTGAADSISIGMKINGTTINAGRLVTGVTNAADSGIFIVEIGPRMANYTNNAVARTASATLRAQAPDYYPTGAGIPTAVITDIVICGITGSTSSLSGITMGIKDVRVYSYPTS